MTAQEMFYTLWDVTLIIGLILTGIGIVVIGIYVIITWITYHNHNKRMKYHRDFLLRYSKDYCKNCKHLGEYFGKMTCDNEEKCKVEVEE